TGPAAHGQADVGEAGALVEPVLAVVVGDGGPPVAAVRRPLPELVRAGLAARLRGGRHDAGVLGGPGEARAAVRGDADDDAVVAPPGELHPGVGVFALRRE